MDNDCARKGPVRKLRQSNQRAIYSCGAGHVSAINEDGSTVESPVPPFEVRLEPNPEIFEKFGYQDDDELPMDYLLKFNEATGKDMPFYHVYANSDPDAPFDHIGDIYTTTPVTTSLFGDERLFFRHEQVCNDYFRIEALGEPDRADKWKKWINNRAGDMEPVWDQEKEGVPGLLDGYTEWEDLIMDGLDGDLSDEYKCPFAWVYL